MKIPALMHLSRLGYGYLSRTQLRRRERSANLLPDVLRTAMERINPGGITEEQHARLMEALQAQLGAEDLGRRFYGTLREGWNGFRLIDFAHPENNLFHSAAELACGTGTGSFRPDITLFVNGIPLAMIEVKTGDRPRGLLAEYDRMLNRLHGDEGRRFLQCAQIWAFSDDRGEEPARLLPAEGAFFTSVMAADFPVFAVRGKQSGAYSGLLPRNPEEEKRILADNGIREMPRTGAFRKNLSPKKTTHRMLTELFRPERFLFLLRYGIRYIREADPEGRESLTRRVLTCEQLSALRTLLPKAKRGWRNWTVPCGGAAGENVWNASLIALLRDLVPGARLYWVSADETELARDRVALQACGIPCVNRENAAGDRLILMTADKAPQTRLKEAAEPNSGGRRVFILPRMVPRYGQKNVFPAGLRKGNPDAILVTRRSDRMPEYGFLPGVSVRTKFTTVPCKTNRDLVK